MNAARLMDRPEDFKKLGINPKQVELWEDGKREKSTPNHFEWWYFDGIMDDGTKIVVQFLSKPGPYFKLNGDFPSVKFTITMPDGRKYHREPKYKAKETSMSTERCDLRYGKHTAVGDLHDYSIHMEVEDGMGCDLRLHSLSSPWRPGTAYMQFDDESKYYTWLCVVPRGEMSGTIVVDNKTIPVTGRGYHDHQWGSVNFHQVFNNWVWARQNYDDYSLLLFDMVTKEKYGKKRFPIIFLQDRDGNVLFESTESVKCEVLRAYHDGEVSDKDYPEEIIYRFERNGKTLEYRLEQKQVIESMGKKNIPSAVRLMLKLMGINLSYARFTGEGTMCFHDGEKEIRRNDELIYEFMYPGEDYKAYM